MTEYRIFWHDYRYFPYERSLALREVAQLAGQEPRPFENGVVVAVDACLERLKRLTYFKGIQAGSTSTIPNQAKLEASSLVNGQTWRPGDQQFPQLRRQSTRYSAHGLHEYKGKFHPQIVRAIGNLAGIEPGAYVLDPFCGSGTTLLEAAHIGWNAMGMDVNPLAVLIANSKIIAFNTPAAVLSRECESLTRRLTSSREVADWRKHLPEPDYLQKWFPLAVLPQLYAILKAINEVQPRSLQNVFRIVLSDICRDVSLQDPNDLRIRRRKDPADNYPAIEMFLDSLSTKVSSIIRAKQYVEGTKTTQQLAIQADTRDAASAAAGFLKRKQIKTFDAAITSPPYATAMPYLDTQRLSLALLGLLGSQDLRNGERQLIGNREIQEKERLNLEHQLRTNTARLPDEVIQFCGKLLTLANDETHGFRRRNVPALAYKYFSDMSSMFQSVRQILKSGGTYALLVGRNSTRLKGEQVSIDTPRLLAIIAESVGWHIKEMLPFETYQRYDVHQSNSIREEMLVVLRSQ